MTSVFKEHLLQWLKLTTITASGRDFNPLQLTAEAFDCIDRDRRSDRNQEDVAPDTRRRLSLAATTSESSAQGCPRRAFLL